MKRQTWLGNVREVTGDLKVDQMLIGGVTVTVGNCERRTIKVEIWLAL